MPHTTTRSPLPPGRAALLDAVLVLVFAGIGRASHDEGNAVAGTLAVAGPFLAGGAVGWGLVRWRSGRWPLALGPGVVVWASTLGLGMLLRVVTGAGTAVSFVLVAGVFLALVLLGWRAVLPGAPRG